MGCRMTLDMNAQTEQMLASLAEWTGFSREMAAIYAIRLVHACVREGLLLDMPQRAWPREADALTGAGARVLAFDALRKKRARE